VPVYLTNIFSTFVTNQGWTVRFDIQGSYDGTTNALYDVFSTTNLSGNNITNSQWVWLERGPTCSTYEYTNQPDAQTFYILGTPRDSDHDGLTDAYELLVSKTNPNLGDTDGDGMPDGWEVANGLNPLVNDANDDPDGDWLTNYQEYNGGTNSTNPHHVMVIAWGDNSDHQSEVPTNLLAASALAGGLFHTLVLQSNGIVSAWGKNDYGQTIVPAGLTNVIAIAAGPYHGIAGRANGTVTNWGSWWPGINLYPATNFPGLSNVVRVAAGTDHDVALRSNGSVVAWVSPTCRTRRSQRI